MTRIRMEFNDRLKWPVYSGVFEVLKGTRYSLWDNDKTKDRIVQSLETLYGLMSFYYINEQLN